MIKRINSNDSKILDYIGNKYDECLYLYLDYSKYGTNNKNIKIWGQTVDNEYTCIILKYHTGMHIFSRDKNYVCKEIIDLIMKEKPTIICAEKSIVETLSKYLDNYTANYGWIRKLTRIDDKYNNSEVINCISVDDFKSVTELLIDDEIGKSYTFDDMYQQFIERNKEGYGRNYIIKDENSIISHAATGAEYKNVAVLAYVITNKKFRGQGYAKKVVGKLCYDLINEQKTVYLVNYSEESTKLYDSIGFVISTKIGKLVLK